MNDLVHFYCDLFNVQNCSHFSSLQVVGLGGFLCLVIQVVALLRNGIGASLLPSETLSFKSRWTSH